MRTWLFLGAAVVGLGQTEAPPPAFEVVSVKVHAEGARSGTFSSPGRVTVGNRTLRQLISEFYRLKVYEVVGAEGWMNSIAYDIDGVAAGPADYARMEPMLRAVLTDRFHLRFHRETRELPTYWLLVAKGGPKMKTPDEKSKVYSGISNESHMLSGRNQPMSRLAFYLSVTLNMPVIDRTGLEDKYDFKLEWADDVHPSAAGDVPDLQKPPLVRAIQDQLGLKLEVHPGPVEVLVIDHAEKPEAN